jgi:hypothetical protein
MLNLKFETEFKFSAKFKVWQSSKLIGPLIVRSSGTHRALIGRSSPVHHPLITGSSPAHHTLIACSSPALTYHLPSPTLDIRSQRL